jgi:hypothetical protein
MCFISEPSLQNLVVCFRAKWKGTVLVPPSATGGTEGEEEEDEEEKTPSSPAAGRRRRRRRRRREKEGQRRQRGSNFYVVRKPAGTEGGSVAFTIFPSSGSVIATGFRAVDLVPPAVTWFAREVCGIPIPTPASDFTSAALFRKWEGEVVNSTHTGVVVCTQQRVSTCKIVTRFKREEEEAARAARAARREDKRKVTVSFRSQFFPGVLVKWSDCGGIVNLFNNGNYILVGARKKSEVRTLHERLCALIKTYWTTTTRPTSCAWTADSSSTA